MYIKVSFKAHNGYLEIHFSDSDTARGAFARIQKQMSGEIPDLIWTNYNNVLDLRTVSAIQLFKKSSIPL